MFQDSDVGILDFGRYLSAIVHILEQLARNLHLHALGKCSYAFGKICPICLEYLTAILGIGHPEGLLVAAHIAHNLCDVAGYGISLSGSAIIGKGIGQFNCLSTSDIRAFDGRCVAAVIVENDYIGILDFWRYLTAIVHILKQLARNLHLHALGKRGYTFGKICPISLKYLAAILGVSHPEGLLIAADIAHNLSDITRNGVGFSRSGIVRKGIGQLNCLSASYFRSFNRRIIATFIRKNNNGCILDFGRYLTAIVHILKQLARNLHLHALGKRSYTFGKICIISLEYTATILGVGHPEGLLIAAHIAHNLGDVTRNGISLGGSGIVRKGICQLDCLSASDWSAFCWRCVSAFIVEDDNCGILHLGNDTAIVLINILHQLAGNLHLHAFGERSYTFGKVSPISLEDSTAILGVGHPESLLIAAYFAHNLSDITRNGVGLGRGCTIGKGIRQFDRLSASDRSSLGRLRATWSAALVGHIEWSGNVNTATESKCRQQHECKCFESLFHNCICLFVCFLLLFNPS